MSTFKIYDDNEHGKILEVWGASTKHPDCIFYFDKFNKSIWVHDEKQIFQWLLECASKMDFPHNALELTEYALENYKPH